MRSRGALFGAFGLVVLGVFGSATVAPAANTAFDCLSTVAKEARTYVAKRLRTLALCHGKNLAVPGGCPAPDPAALARLDERLVKYVTRRCTGVPLASLGFPGPCFDANASDGFTADDLAACLTTSHAGALDAVLPLLYDDDLVAPVRYADLNCQRAIGKRGAGFVNTVLGAIQKCRLGLLRDPFGAITADRCAVDDPVTVKAIARAERKLRHLIDGRCSDAQAARLFLCEPDQPLVTGALDCLIARLESLVDDRDPAAPPDLIDYEFAGRPAAVCGDGVLDAPGEECDGAADAACPGLCGPAAGPFPCLCQNVPRQRVLEHASADFDLGWSGIAHDQHVPEGGGYVVDLFDCDGPGGPDTVCHVGPSCSLAPHVPCSPGPTSFVTGDSLCAAFGMGVCRKTAGGATGPHCRLDVQQRCDTDVQCPGSGNACVKTLHGPPLPIAAGGVSTCLVRVFTEDVVGTADLATGATAVRMRQRVDTHLGGALAEPCPVCGGFCEGSATSEGPGARTPCAIDADCPSAPFRCVTDAVCSFGPNADAPCRPNPPSGAATVGFGTTSIDCTPPASTRLASIDLLDDPRSTTTVTREPGVTCTAPDVAGNTCVDGANAGAACLSGGDCASGDCRPQCFCAGQARPNGCDAACVGGSNDAAPCASPSECPGGFCHAGDCRLDPSDTDSCQEGRCTAGPTVGRCSSSSYVPCGGDAQCAPPACPSCEPGETCVLAPEQCFVSGAIERCGTPGIPERTTAAIGCAASLGQAAIDALYGTPGPTASTQPETAIVVGF